MDCDGIKVYLKEEERLENRSNAILLSPSYHPPLQFVFSDYSFRFPRWLSFCACFMILAESVFKAD